MVNICTVQVDQIGQYSRKNCLHVYGEEENRNEKLGAVSINLINENLGFDVQPYGIDRAQPLDT